MFVASNYPVIPYRNLSWHHGTRIPIAIPNHLDLHIDGVARIIFVLNFYPTTLYRCVIEREMSLS